MSDFGKGNEQKRSDPKAEQSFQDQADFYLNVNLAFERGLARTDANLGEIPRFLRDSHAGG